jgi:uroporphyrin-III C-methyltransferase/precorrin-2 dehydrogenase/sirohydrochlorin ferrochelatase
VTDRIKAFPVSWVTTGRELLILGGCGERLCRLAHAVRYDWARIHVILPPGAKPVCAACTGDQRVTVSTREVTEDDVARAGLVLEGTRDNALAARLAAWCRKHHVPLNAMDKLDLCDIYYSSLVFREPLVLAISSGGDAPALTSVLSKRLEKMVGPGWGRAAQLLAELRRNLPNTSARSALLCDLAGNEAFLDLVERDDEQGMRKMIQEAHDRL